ncbi:MAG: hypothetical protein MJ116_04875 [Lachnospiraceae bacterium]|nr:hypothetical protein [Lachnospiraceae bacterium]
MKKKMYKLLALGMAVSLNLSMVQPVMAFEDSDLSAGECKHEWEFVNALDDDLSHGASCSLCPESGYYDHSYEDGICSECNHICQHSDFDESGNCNYCELPAENATCEHGDDKYKVWRYADDDKHILVCECGETVEEESHNQNACDPYYTQVPETDNYISKQHIFHCDVCYGEKTEAYEDHIIAEGDSRCSKCGYLDESTLSSMRATAKQALDDYLAKNYNNCIIGSAMKEVINSAKNDIDTFYDQASMNSRVDNAKADMPAALLSDAKTDAFQKITQEINKKERSDEFHANVQAWMEMIDAAKNISAVQDALTDILDNKIPEAEEAYPYVEPLARVYRAIAGSYGNNDVTVCKDEDGSLVLRYNGDIMPVNDVYILEDGTITVYAGCTFTFSDNNVSIYGRRNALVGSYDKTENAAPDNTVPTCPTCHEPMILVSTNEDGCSWICDANGCVISNIKHAPTEICICESTHIHIFDENGKCTVKDCDYVSPTRELAAKKAEFEAYKENAVAAADEKATSEDSADVKQLITNAKAAINAIEYSKDVSAEELQTQIENILLQLDADIAAQKEAEKQPDLLCVTEKVISPKSGFYGLYLNGIYAGDFTFKSVTGGWSIQDSQGYLTVENGVLTHTNVPAAWGYKNGSFFQTSQAESKGILGCLFKNTTTTNYYLASSTSVSTKSVKTEIHETVLASHIFTGYVSQKDGTHKRTCTACGVVETNACSYDEETGYCICGAFDPARVHVTIHASVEKETQKYMFGLTKTTYRATITTDAEGTTIKKVEYSTNNGKTWTTGSSFTSSNNITSFMVRATDAEGNVYTYTYPEQ